ncbi:PREDICTED: rac GTPase-activating protein 1-like [Priapulus caudatus]|uniref:Rac GTPase-activating protein 1-like n=1 Tax=Priapulus caudatus TaxID=37621 RepID=A0ABM1DYG2_PRICU|nr:PREDICTED: rac GTPase-activating protein 1-like [Priapulus caudatus]XP_014664984.1 PREDICTED: rac GTPase-activating protein 1-like [Priapulus caudatus]
MSSSKLSLVARYDDLLCNTAVLTAGIESEFVSTIQYQDGCWKRLQSVQEQLLDANNLINKLRGEKTTLESKLVHARWQIENEMGKRQKAENEIEKLEEKLSMIRKVMQNSGQNQSEEDRRMTMLTLLDRRPLTAGATYRNQSRVYGAGDRYTGEDMSCASLNSASITGDLLSTSQCSGSDCTNCSELLLTPVVRNTKRVDTTELQVERPHAVSKRRRGEDGEVKQVEQEESLMSKISVVLSDVSDVTDSNPFDFAQLPPRKMFRRSMSESQLSISRSHIDVDEAEEVTPAVAQREGGRCHSATNSPGNSRSSHVIMVSPKSGLHMGLYKVHDFCSKTVFTLETCDPCQGRIKFGKTALKCRDCRIICHERCGSHATVPCIPYRVPTMATAVNSKGVVADYAPLDGARVPGLIVRCVMEVEAKGLSEIGIYRIPGSVKEVKELSDAFMKGKGPQYLAKMSEIHTVCSAIKAFLRDLREPLITYHLWKDFTSAAEKDSVELLVTALNRLPIANRHTLAFMVAHLQNVKRNKATQMTVIGLARIFGPCLVGYSDPNINANAMLMESRLQSAVVELLLRLPHSFWDGVLRTELPPREGTTKTHLTLPPTVAISPRTPDTLPVSHLHSMLGSLRGSSSNATCTKSPGSAPPVNTDSTQRGIGKSQRWSSVKGGKVVKQFFASPQLH